MGNRDMSEGMSYSEIAKQLGISRQSVRNIEKKALRKLKNSGKLNQFKELAGDNWRESDYNGRNLSWESLI